MSLAAFPGLYATASIGQERWVPWVREVDVLLVAGGDATHQCHWTRQSGRADLLQPDQVPVQLSQPRRQRPQLACGGSRPEPPVVAYGTAHRYY
jgi:hypothetical protein